MQKFETQDKAEQAWKEEAPYQAVLFDDNRTLDKAKDCKTKEETKICTFYNGEEEMELVVRDYWERTQEVTFSHSEEWSLVVSSRR